MKPRRSLSVLYLAAVFLLLLIAACTPGYLPQITAESITLYYQNNNAKEVLFAASIDHYRIHPAREVEGGVWEVTVPRVEEFTYFYLVDGIPTIPDCQAKTLDDFGTKNCLFVSEM